MSYQLFELNYDAAEVIAKEYFIEACGFRSENKNHQELLAEGLQTLEEGKSGIHLSAVVYPMKCDTFHDHTITIGEKAFTCTAFEQISDDNVLEVYSYLLRVGECKSMGNNLADQYYAEVWGNAFLEGGRETLRDQIICFASQLHPSSFVTNSFGPGFYGMSVNKIMDLIQVLDPSLIGMSVNENGTINPTKSCGGFFLAVRESEKLPALDCRDCIGHEEGCLFCGGRNCTPSRDTCLSLLTKYGTPAHVVRHCKAVTETALRIGRALNQKGLDLDLNLLEGAALLHDIARVEENHGVKGSLIAEKHGYGQVAKLIKCHMFYATDPYKEKINEQDILCLADRMVKEDEYVGLDARMQYVLDKFIGDSNATEKIRYRLEENRIIKKRIEDIIGMTLNQLME